MCHCRCHPVRNTSAQRVRLWAAPPKNTHVDCGDVKEVNCEFFFVDLPAVFHRHQEILLPLAYLPTTPLPFLLRLDLKTTCVLCCSGYFFANTDFTVHIFALVANRLSSADHTPQRSSGHIVSAMNPADVVFLPLRWRYVSSTPRFHDYHPLVRAFNPSPPCLRCFWSTTWSSLSVLWLDDHGVKRKPLDERVFLTHCSVNLFQHTCEQNGANLFCPRSQPKTTFAFCTVIPKRKRPPGQPVRRRAAKSSILACFTTTSHTGAPPSSACEHGEEN